MSSSARFLIALDYAEHITNRALKLQFETLKRTEEERKEIDDCDAGGDACSSSSTNNDNDNYESNNMKNKNNDGQEVRDYIGDRDRACMVLPLFKRAFAAAAEAEVDGDSMMV